jgi:hypothetical protein
LKVCVAVLAIALAMLWVVFLMPPLAGPREYSVGLTVKGNDGSAT